MSERSDYPCRDHEWEYRPELEIGVEDLVNPNQGNASGSDSGPFVSGRRADRNSSLADIHPADRQPLVDALRRVYNELTLARNLVRRIGEEVKDGTYPPSREQDRRAGGKAPKTEDPKANSRSKR